MVSRVHNQKSFRKKHGLVFPGICLTGLIVVLFFFSVWHFAPWMATAFSPSWLSTARTATAPSSAQADRATQSTPQADRATQPTVSLPILMYHGLLKDTAMQNKFVISPHQLEEDLQYLNKQGYTTLFMSDLIESMKKGSPLPKKPIILTFDDGYYNNYLYAYPLLKKYHAKAVISIIGYYTDLYSQTDPNHPTYSHITWDQADAMTHSGLVELQNHTYDMHTYDKGRKGAMQKNGESDQQYAQILDDDVAKLQEKIYKETGQLPNTFTYPFGFCRNNSDEFLKKMGFSATLSCTEGVNQLRLHGTDRESQLYGLKRILRPPHMNSAEFFEKYGIV